MNRRFVPLSLLVALLASACGGSADRKDRAPFVTPDGFALSQTKAFSVKADWQLPLTAGGAGANEVTLTFIKDDGEKPSSVELNAFHPRMPMMNNHGTDEDTQAFHKTDDPSVLRVTGIYFNMPGGVGEWVVTVTATVEGRTDDVKLSLPVVD